jgi:RNA polymerase sigma factor (sigma-70 family)
MNPGQTTDSEDSTSEEHLDDLIDRLNDGDVAAAERVFLAYEPYLRIAVSRQLNGGLRAKLDTMDIVQAVWADVLIGFREAGWRFSDRRQLRAFLLTLARNRLIDRRRHFRRAIEKERPLHEASPGDLPATKLPRPSEIVQGQELWVRMLDQCPPQHRELLRLNRQGLNLTEIATRTGLHEGSVRRILYALAKKVADESRPTTPETEPTLGGEFE